MDLSQKIIRQFASKEATSIDIFEKATDRCIYSYRKAIQPDGKSYLTKTFDFLKKQGTMSAHQKLEKENSFMSATFKIKSNGMPEQKGDFVDMGGRVKKGEISYLPSTNTIDTDNKDLSIVVSIFNRLFGVMKF